jgi:hypothetical protein
MSGYQLGSEILNPAFLDILKVVKPFECIPFFGTLLGLARSGSLISGDDDIDFVCRLTDLEAVTQELKSAFSVVMVLDTREPKWGSGTRTLVLEYRKALIHVDLYCPVELSGFFLFPCHWSDSRQDDKGWLKVPCSAIQSLNIDDFSSLGKQIESLQPVAAYLYGADWRTPSRKNIDHIHTLVHGVPYVRPTNAFERILGLTKLFYSNFYWILKKSGALGLDRAKSDT